MRVTETEMGEERREREEKDKEKTMETGFAEEGGFRPRMEIT